MALLHPSQNTPANRKLLSAVSCGDVQGTQACLEAGADPDCLTRREFSVLASAIHGDHTEVVRVLLNAGAAVHFPPAHKPQPHTTPWSSALYHSKRHTDALFWMLAGDHLDVGRFNTWAGCNLSHHPLVAAVCGPHPDIFLKLLAQYRPERDGVPEKLFFERIMEELRKNGTPAVAVAFLDTFGLRTPANLTHLVEKAAAHGNSALVAWGWDQGVRPSDDAIKCLASKNQDALLGRWLDADPDSEKILPSLLVSAAARGHRRTFSLLWERWQALGHTLGDLDRLVEKATSDAPRSAFQEATPLGGGLLHFSMRGILSHQQQTLGRHTWLSFLLELGTSVHTTNTQGQTALHLVFESVQERNFSVYVQRRILPLVSVLMKYGAQPDIQNANGVDCRQAMRTWAPALFARWEADFLAGRLAASLGEDAGPRRRIRM